MCDNVVEGDHVAFVQVATGIEATFDLDRKKFLYTLIYPVYNVHVVISSGK